jgi:hypothetical protein
MKRRGHPQKVKLSEALAEDAERIKARKGLIDKTATIIKAPGTDSEAEVGGSFRPNDEQLARINEFTRTPKTADEVICFSTLSCNDIVDRDDDQFTTECVKDFSELEQPFSPVGKSFMVNHDYKIENAVGRIFGTDTKRVSGSLFLTNEVYLPNTERYAGFIEDLDFGINWAVSVGVMLGADECSLPWCKAPFSSYGWWCSNGHDKGLYYTEDAEEDSWGYPAPCDPKTKGAEKCVRLFKDPKDFYELSQVFLGAQYYAALEKDPGFASVMKSVSSGGVPIIGLGHDMAEKLPIPHFPQKVSEALKRFKPKEAEDGSLVWTDDQGLRWTFDPESPEDGVMSLGRAASDNEEGDDADGESGQLDIDGSGDDDSSGDGSSDTGANAGAGDGGSREASDQSSAGSEQPLGGESGAVALDADEDEEESEEEEDTETVSEDSDDSEDSADESESVDEKAVVRAAVKAKLPDAVRNAAADGLDALLSACAKHMQEQAQKVSALEPKAALGEQFITELRADAIAWYVKAHQEKDNAKVKTEAFEKLLDRAGDDAELLSEIIEEQKSAARAKFPKVRRSSFPSDPNEKTKLSGFGSDDSDIEEYGGETDTKVRRLHG